MQNIKKDKMNKPICPKAIFVEITNICNFDCIFCPNHLMSRNKGFMDFDLFKKIVFNAVSAGIETFNLWIMGEPFLHPQVFEFINFAKENSIKLSLITNGGLLSEENTDKMFSLNLSKDDSLLISCLISNASSFKLRGSKGIDYASYEKGITDLLEKKQEKGSEIKIIVLYLINVFNDIIKVPGLIVDANGVLEIIKGWYNFSQGLQRKLNSEINLKLPAKSSIENSIKRKMGFELEFLPGTFLGFKWLTNWGKVILPEGFKVIPSRYGFCSHPFESTGIFWNGDITLCCDDYNGELVVGNVRDKTIDEILNGEKAQRIRTAMEKGILLSSRCQNCQGTIVDQEGHILSQYSNRFLLERAIRHLKLHGVEKTLKKSLGRIRGIFFKWEKI
jgi:radical SAM protein with 4Fe4S-binding SPASM domain